MSVRIFAVLGMKTLSKTYAKIHAALVTRRRKAKEHVGMAAVLTKMKRQLLESLRAVFAASGTRILRRPPARMDAVPTIVESLASMIVLVARGNRRPVAMVGILLSHVVLVFDNF